MGTKVFLGYPPARIVQWIKDHSGPAQHEETWYKYAGDTEWRTVMLSGTIALMNDMGEPTGQIENPTNIVVIEIGTGTQVNPVTSIGSGAFEYCSGLTSVTIPDSVTNIWDSAFAECNGLTSVTIGNGVTNIRDSAFYDCSGLTSVMIPASVTSIGTYAFYNCSGLTSVTIPDSVTSIRYRVFYGCSGLTSVTITANGGNAENVKQMMIDAGVSSSITWNMPN